MRRLDLGRAPGEVHADVLHVVRRQIALRHADGLRRDALALEVGGALDVRIFRHGQHPAQRIAPDFAVDQLAHLDHVRARLLDPVESGQAAVEHAFLHEHRHFLRAQQHALDLRVVDRRVQRTRIDLDIVARLREKGGRGGFEASFRKAEDQFVLVGIQHSRDSSMVCFQENNRIYNIQHFS